MSEEIQIELKKPLDKMTSKELKELAIEQIPQITGASGMEKEELLAAIKEVLGMEDEEGEKTSPYKDQIIRLKKQIKDLRVEKSQVPSSEKQKRNQLRRKIHTLKKRTRRLANV